MATLDVYLDELLAPEPAPGLAPAPALADTVVHGSEPSDAPQPVVAVAAQPVAEAAPTAPAAPVQAAPIAADDSAPRAMPELRPARAVPDLSAFLPPAHAHATPRADAGRTARTATGGHRWLRVCVARDRYAFELLRVQEVVRMSPVVAVRGARHAVLGVMNLRGRIVPVFDLGLWLDVGAITLDERARVVVIERDDELIGVLVTAVEDVVSLEREHVEPPLLGTDPGPTLGVARVGDAPTVLLDADALFNEH